MCKDEDILNATEVFEAGLKQRKGGDRFVTVVGRGLWRWIDDCCWEKWGCGDCCCWERFVAMD